MLKSTVGFLGFYLLAATLSFAAINPQETKTSENSKHKNWFGIEDFEGTYAAQFEGNLGSVLETKVITNGTIKSDGRGRARGNFVRVVNGKEIINVNLECTYEINRDGTGNMNCVVNDGTPSAPYTVGLSLGIGDNRDTVFFVTLPTPNTPFETASISGSFEK